MGYNARMKRILLITNPDAIRRSDKTTAILAYALKHDWDVSIVSFDSDVKLCEISQTLHPDGIIIEGFHFLEDTDRHQLERIPTVYLDAGYAHARFAVSSDSVEIARLAITELKRSRPAAILFATNTPKRLWSIEREQAARSFCQSSGIHFASVHADFAAALCSFPKPIGVFAVHDNMALAVYDAVKTAKFSIPAEIRVVSVDNNPVYTANLRPSLTSIELNSYQAGSAAAELLDKLLPKRSAMDTHIRIRPSGIVRRASSVTVSTNLGIQKALTAIRENACCGLSVPDVAEIMGMSRRAAEIAFARETGSTIYEAILAERFEEVERLLRKPNITLGTIANRCGWHSQSHLARAFRLRYGKTMSAWQASEVNEPTH